MRTTKPILLLFTLLTLAAALHVGADVARAQAPAGAYPGYYYSPGGYSGGYYFQPGYYPVPAARTAPAVPVYQAPAARYAPTPVRHSSFISHNDWSTGRSNYPIPLTKPWMMPNRY